MNRPTALAALAALALTGAPAAAQDSLDDAQQGSLGPPQGQFQAPGAETGFPSQQPGFAGQVPGGVSPQPGYQNTQPGYDLQPGYGGQQPGYAGQPQPGYGGQPQPGFSNQARPGSGGQPPIVDDRTAGQTGAAGQRPPGGAAPALDPEQVQVLDQLGRYEREDLGVPATPQLRSGDLHGATPARIPGGQVITTRGVIELMRDQQTPFLIFDVLGAQETLPGAIPVVEASWPGSFDDEISRKMGAHLQQVTQGDTRIPLIFYCASRECWMSYNAALRAINLGYGNVLWYRGGLDAWKEAGGQTVPAGQPMGEGAPPPPGGVPQTGQGGN